MHPNFRSSKRRPRITPLFSSTDIPSGIQVRNATDSPQLVSAPLVQWLKRIEPGSTEEIAAPTSGELILHLLSAPRDHPASAQVWVVDGMHVEVEPNGRYAIRGLAAGEHTLRAWHPRLPPSPPHPVDVAVGGVSRIDLDITVDLENSLTEVRE